LSIVWEGDRDECTVSCSCLASALTISVFVEGMEVRLSGFWKMFGRASAFPVAASVSTHIGLDFPPGFIRLTVFCVMTTSKNCQYHHAAINVRIYVGSSHLVYDDANLITRIAQDHHIGDR